MNKRPPRSPSVSIGEGALRAWLDRFKGTASIVFHEHRSQGQPSDSYKSIISRTRHFADRHPTRFSGRKAATALARDRVS